jgi:hypothetical protein
MGTGATAPEKKKEAVDGIKVNVARRSGQCEIIERKKVRMQGKSCGCRVEGSEMFSVDSWLRPEEIQFKIGSEGAVVILNLFFVGKIETTQNGETSTASSDVQENSDRTTYSCIIMSLHHVGPCIACIATSISPFPVEVIRSNVRSDQSACCGLDLVTYIVAGGTQKIADHRM